MDVGKNLNVAAYVTLLCCALCIHGNVYAKGGEEPDIRSRIYREISEIPEKSGGIYYAYPETESVTPEPPEGYRPFYLSHYGRHGSRHLIKEYQYERVYGWLDSASRHGMLTPLGENVKETIGMLKKASKGKAGSLTPMGESQHRAIATRLAQSYPMLTADSCIISIKSSTEPRCIVSMAAFCETLKGINPKIRFDREITPGNMDFIAYSSPEAKAIAKDSLEWRMRFYHFCDSVIRPERLMSSLFSDPSGVADPQRMMVYLHNIAVGIQNLTADASLLDIFTDDELFALWQHLNYNMYVRHCAAPEVNAAGMRSAESLLRHIIEEADNAIVGKTPYTISLIFGHDTNLIRLLARMDIIGFNAEEDDPLKYCEAWQDYKAAPMAANLQITFLRNEAGNIIILLRHNERPVKLDMDPVGNTEYYYPWQQVKERWRH